MPNVEKITTLPSRKILKKLTKITKNKINNKNSQSEQVVISCLKLVAHSQLVSDSIKTIDVKCLSNEDAEEEEEKEETKEVKKNKRAQGQIFGDLLAQLKVKKLLLEVRIPREHRRTIIERISHSATRNTCPSKIFYQNHQWSVSRC